MAILAEQARMEEERQQVVMWREAEEQRLAEIWRAQETEEEEDEEETGAGPSVPKKRKMDERVSFELQWKGTEINIYIRIDNGDKY